MKLINIIMAASILMLIIGVGMAYTSGPIEMRAGSDITGGVGSTVKNINSAQYVDVTAYGAVGNGIADDTAKIVAAEAAAYSSGKTLLFPPGTYNQNGHLHCRVSVSGYGAILNETATSIDAGESNAILTYTGIHNVFIKGIEIRGNWKNTGIIIRDTLNANVVIEDVNISKVVMGGIKILYCSDIIVEHAKVSQVKYGTTVLPTSWGAADGYFCYGSQNITIRDSYAYDFRRIGFVSDGTPRGDRILIDHCVAEYAHNATDSTGECNAGFWGEYTNNMDLIDCTAINIGNVGNRGSAGAVFNFYSTIPNAKNIVRFKVLQTNSKSISTGISLCGTLNYENFTVDDCTIQNATTGIYIQHEPKTVYINNVVFTGSARVQDIYFGMSIPGCSYTLTNTGTVANPIVHRMTGSVDYITLENDVILYGSNSYESFLGNYQLKGTNCYFSYDGSGLALLFGPSTYELRSDHKVILDNCKFDSASPVYLSDDEFNATYLVSNTIFKNTGFHIWAPLFAVYKFDNCIWNLGSTGNAIIATNSNRTSSSYGGLLQVSDCYFTGYVSSVVPIKKWNYNMKNAVINNNVYNTTNLYDLTSTGGGTTTADHNVKI